MVTDTGEEFNCLAFAKVLILIVMEDGHWRWARQSPLKALKSVLILIVMEDGHWQYAKIDSLLQGCRLNPYCNGRWSLTGENFEYWKDCFGGVLILIVMEDGHWQLLFTHLHKNMGSLNPYCNGRWSLTAFSDACCERKRDCLNPYCNGRWSLTKLEQGELEVQK